MVESAPVGFADAVRDRQPVLNERVDQGVDIILLCEEEHVLGVMIVDLPVRAVPETAGEPELANENVINQCLSILLRQSVLVKDVQLAQYIHDRLESHQHPAVEKSGTRLQQRFVEAADVFVDLIGQHLAADAVMRYVGDDLAEYRDRELLPPTSFQAGKLLDILLRPLLGVLGIKNLAEGKSWGSRDILAAARQRASNMVDVEVMNRVAGREVRQKVDEFGDPQVRDALQHGCC